MYGPNTEAVQAMIDIIPVLTEDEFTRLEAATRFPAGAWYAAWDAAHDAAWGEAWYAADNVVWDAAWAGWGEAWYAAHNAVWDGAWAGWGAGGAILATVTYDLATEDGPYTIAQRDMLLAPWIKVCGMPS